MRKQQVIIPEKLQKKFNKDWIERQIIVFSAFSGFGKTTLVKELLKKYRYSMRDAAVDQDVALPIQEGIEVVVIDQFHLIDDVTTQVNIKKMIEERPDVRFVFITRGQVPKWLIEYRYQEKLMVYHSNLMNWEIEEVDVYLGKQDIHLSEQQINELYAVVHGYPLAVVTFGYLYEERENKVSIIASEALHKLYRRIETDVFEKYDESAQEFLLTVSQFEEFDVDMIRVITGKEEVAQTLQRLLEKTTVIGIKGTDTYGCDALFRIFLKWKNAQVQSESEQKELYNRAAMYYEGHKQTYKAMKYYVKAGKGKKVQMMLEENGMTNPGIARYMEMEPFYRSLPYGVILKSPSLMSGMCMLESIRTNFEESEEWFERLVEYGKRLKRNDPNYEKVKKAILFLQIALPHRTNKSLQKVFRQVIKLPVNEKLDLPEFSITMGGISVINGGQDYSEWCKIDDHIFKTMGPVVKTVLGRESVGITECGICESKFEKGEHYHKHLVKMMESYSDIKQKGCLDTEVVFHGILARISLAEGKVQQAKDVLYRILACLPEEEKGRYAPNIEALLCRIGLLTGDKRLVDDWYRYKAPKETFDMWLLLRYQYRIEAEVLIQKEQYLESILLLTRVLSYTTKCSLRIDEIQCRMLLAINYYKMGDNTWRMHLKQGIRLGGEYNLVHTIAQFGQAILPLLKEYPVERCSRNQIYCKRVLEDTKKQAILYQKYLEAEAKSTAVLSAQELKVLELICQNKSNAEISEILDIKLTTVKTHMSHIFQKMGVRRRSEVKSEAKRQRLVEDYLLL